jgi:hypothetical protein
VEVDEAEAAEEAIDLPSTVEETSSPAQQQDAGVEADTVHTEAPVDRDQSLPVGETTRPKEGAVLETVGTMTVFDGETAGPETSVAEVGEALQAKAPVVRDSPSLVNATETLTDTSERAESLQDDSQSISEPPVPWRTTEMLVCPSEDGASSCGDHEFRANETEREVSVFDPELADETDELTVLMQNLSVDDCGRPEVHVMDVMIDVGDHSGMD